MAHSEAQLLIGELLLLTDEPHGLQVQALH